MDCKKMDFEELYSKEKTILDCKEMDFQEKTLMD